MEHQGVLLFVDADSCPRELRSIMLRAIVRRSVPALFVADRSLPDVVEQASLAAGQEEARPLIQLVVVPKGIDSADDYLVAHATQGSLAITRDVILADRLASKGLTVLDDRGGVYTKATVKERLSMRNIMTSLREQGVFAEQTRPLGKRDIQAFANALDSQLTRLLKQN
jgi:uncharacterized protein YaiI (UPF0178 family)